MLLLLMLLDSSSSIDSHRCRCHLKSFLAAAPVGAGLALLVHASHSCCDHACCKAAARPMQAATYRKTLILRRVPHLHVLAPKY
jgi:hypothetical protein